MLAHSLQDSEITTAEPAGSPESGLASAVLDGAEARWSPEHLDAPTGALARCVGDPERFTNSEWGRRPLIHDSGQPATDLLGLDDVDALVTSSAAMRVSALRVMKDGRAVPPSSYMSTGRRTGPHQALADVQGMLQLMTEGTADPERLLQAVDDGATLVLQGLQRFHPPLARFCRELELDLGHECQANAYLTPADSQGLSLHSDPHDVIVLQSVGTKSWEFHASPWQLAEGQRPEPRQVTLRPGLVQYLPAGTPHLARAQSGTSLHITIGITPLTWADVLNETVVAIIEEMAGQTGSRDALPANWTACRQTAAATLGQHLRQLTATLTAADPCAVIAARTSQFLTSRRRLMHGALVDRQHIGQLTDLTTLTRRSGVPCTVLGTDGEGRLRLHLGDRELRMPSWLLPAVRHIAANDHVAPADLRPFLTPEARIVLCRRLVREGLLRVPGGCPGD